MGLVINFFFFSKVALLSLWGALSDEKLGLTFVGLLSIQSIVISQYLRKLFTLPLLDTSVIHNIYNALVSSGSVQQLMP
jgi:hypothetical protein